MRGRAWLLGLICALSCAGCGLETRNRIIVFGEMDGVIDGHEVSFDRDTRLMESEALDGRATATLEQTGFEETVQMEVIFETGIDDVADGIDEAGTTVDVRGRTRAYREAWSPYAQAQILSVDAYLTETEEIDTINVRGVHEQFDIHIVVDFAPVTSPNALVEQSDAPPPEPQIVEITLHYDRDRVRDKPRERSSTSSDYDC